QERPRPAPDADRRGRGRGRDIVLPGAPARRARLPAGARRGVDEPRLAAAQHPLEHLARDLDLRAPLTPAGAVAEPRHATWTILPSSTAATPSTRTRQPVPHAANV